jgi:hypothetical protein
MVGTMCDVGHCIFVFSAIEETFIEELQQKIICFRLQVVKRIDTSPTESY